jgi:DNA-binding HxlR family transcriptional regulator
MMVLWRLPEKGKDMMAVLMQLVAFASKWYSIVVFDAKGPRKLRLVLSFLY